MAKFEKRELGVLVGIAAVSILAFICCLWKTLDPPAAPKGSGPNGTSVIHRFDYLLFRNGSDEALTDVRIEVRAGGSVWHHQDYTFDAAAHQVYAFVINKELDPADEISEVVCTIPDFGGGTGEWKCKLELTEPDADFRNARFTFGKWRSPAAPPVDPGDPDATVPWEHPDGWEHQLAGDGVVNNAAVHDGLVHVHASSTGP